jgi:hypothetical protein
MLVIACPIRYWALEIGVDATWRFALNYAPLHGYAIGRDYVYTTGPLVHLLFPEHFGNNLRDGLIFQFCLWAVLGAILFDVFARGGFRLRNLAVFAAGFCLTSPFFWFNSLGPENLMLVAALLLLVMYRLRGEWLRYVGALLFIGAMPLFKMSAGVLGAAALVGFLVERVIDHGVKAWREVLAAAIIPVSITCGVCLALTPSFSSFVTFLRGSAEVMSGYSSAMSSSGPEESGVPELELVLAAEVVAILIGALWMMSTTMRSRARFFFLLVALPLFVSFKHGYVRQDEHVVNFFCFVALSLALVLLTIDLTGATGRRALILMLAYGLIWQDTMGRQYGLFASNGIQLEAVNKSTFARASGYESLRMLWGLVRYDHLPQKLDASVTNYPETSQIEPGIVSMIGDAPVASLSWDYTNFVPAGLHLVLYPTLQRAVAYTPWLDRWNAEWVRDKGPKYLLFDGLAIDARDPWIETPAMWMEIYRWYDSVFQGERNLLLERRAHPRFRSLESIGHVRLKLSDAMQIPASADPVFWTMKCGYNTTGLVEKAVGRIPPVFLAAHDGSAAREPGRVAMELVESPVLGNYLPYDLPEFAALLRPEAGVGNTYPGYNVDAVWFEGDGVGSYASSCEVEFLKAVN